MANVSQLHNIDNLQLAYFGNLNVCRVQNMQKQLVSFLPFLGLPYEAIQSERFHSQLRNGPGLQHFLTFQYSLIHKKD